MPPVSPTTTSPRKRAPTQSWFSRRATAADLRQLKIPGLYSYAGFHDFFFKQLEAVAAKLESEHWVMGDAG